jgi:hypothetical protein
VTILALREAIESRTPAWVLFIPIVGYIAHALITKEK